jgi:predicted SnoaL-like aldol condensation-catalyzing enzyme
MFINKVINFQEGWDLLSEDKPEQLQEIIDSIGLLDRNILLDPQYQRHFRPSEDEPNRITSMTLSNCWRSLIENEGWEHVRIVGEPGRRNRLYLRNCKEGVSIRILSRDRIMLPNWVFVETQKAYEIGACEISVLLVPMENVQEIYTRSMVPKISFEDVEVQLSELSPIRAIAPFVIIGFSEIESPIEIIDVLSEEAHGQINIIDKCIEFSPEQYQAGMGILSYFGEIIKAKHPEIQAKVRIEQDGSVVRLHIEAEDGTKEIIEKTLEEYSRVISNQESIETLFDNKIHIVALKNKLEMANMEVRQTREILELTKEASSTRLLSLEEEVQHLRSHIGSQMSLASESNKIIKTQAAASSKVVLELINSSNLLVKDLLADKLMGLKVLEALKVIDERLERGVRQDDEVALKEALRVISEESPDIIDELGIALKNTAYGVCGNTVYQWLVSISNMLC